MEATTTAGTLRGHRSGNAVAFRGVRYGHAERFAQAEPPQPWDGLRVADQPGPAAPQNVAETEAVPDMAVAEISEDCLSAEIWTPDVNGSRPVLVWIPGGRFQIGGAGIATYDGAGLAADGDLVVVGLNYRLGVLGFLADETIPSNLGLRDLLAALRWIRQEIAAFGGDPGRVTLMGESAGAGCIAHLLAIPETEALLAGAILLSGAPGSTLDPAQGSVVRDCVLRHAGVASVEELARLPLDDLLAAQAAADAELLASVGMMPLHPIIDPGFLPTAPLEAARAAALAAVPMLISTTAHEMELFRDAVPELPAEFAVPYLAQRLAGALGPAADEARAEQGWAAVEGDLVEAIADTDLHVPAGLLADTHCHRGLSVWRSQFAWEAPGIGAAHAVDLPFVFGTLDVGEWREFVGAIGPRADAADQLSAELRQAIAAFCHQGAPESPVIGRWPEHDPSARNGVRLAETPSVVADLGGPRFRAWTEVTQGEP